MTTIYFIRHGQASFGAESYDQLSPNGELQAKILGQYFDAAKYGGYKAIVFVRRRSCVGGVHNRHSGDWT